MLRQAFIFFYESFGVASCVVCCSGWYSWMLYFFGFLYSSGALWSGVWGLDVLCLVCWSGILVVLFVGIYESLLRGVRRSLV